MGFFDDLIGNVTKFAGGLLEGQRETLSKVPVVGGAMKAAHEGAFNGLERLGHGVYWAYSNVVSQPISTLMQVGSESGLGVTGAVSPGSILAKFKRDGVGGAIGVDPSKWGNVAQAETWGKSYKRAEYISPGQASVAIDQMQAEKNFKLQEVLLARRF